MCMEVMEQNDMIYQVLDNTKKERILKPCCSYDCAESYKIMMINNYQSKIDEIKNTGYRKQTVNEFYGILNSFYFF